MVDTPLFSKQPLHILKSIFTRPRSVFHRNIFDENEIYPYVTEGIGEDILPENVNFESIDHFEKVTDKDAALYTRKLAREEGIFAGNSCGAAVKAVLQLKDNFNSDRIEFNLGGPDMFFEKIPKFLGKDLPGNFSFFLNGYGKVYDGNLPVATGRLPS